MKASSKSSNEARSKYIFEHFLRIPSLAFDLEVFPYARFETETPDLNTSLPSIPMDLMIGKQAELCFEHYLKVASRYDVLAHNIQIQGTSETMGELDYIVFDKQLQQQLHIELACKFYLLDYREEGNSAWIGPNRNDSLDQKLNKLQQKQFPLLFKEETKQLLDDLRLDVSETAQQLCLKAFLFIHKDVELKDVSAKWRPSIVGRWMGLESFKEEDPTVQYALPKKTAWLIPSEHTATWMSHSELLPLIAEQHKNKKTPMIYKKINGALKLFFIVWWL